MATLDTTLLRKVPTPWTPGRYPPSRRSDHVDTYKSEAKGEVRVPDPYEWLEDGGSEETKGWIDAQQAFTQEYLAKNPDRQKLEDAIRENTNYARFSSPDQKEDGRWYWSYNSGLQAQYVIYRSKDSTLPDFSKEDGPGGEVFFDSNLLSDDGTAALAVTAFSRSAEYFAYGVSKSGSDAFTIYVRRANAPLASVDGKRPSHHDDRLPDELRGVKFSGITWTHDNKGFFYKRFPARANVNPDEDTEIETFEDGNSALYYHRIGTPQEDDVLVMKDPEHPKYMWSTGISELDGRYLELYVSRDTARKNLLWIADLHETEIGPNMKWIKLIDSFDASYSVLANNGTKLFIQTNKDALQYKIVSVDLKDEKKEFVDHIPEDKGALLKGATTVADNRLALTYQRDVKDEVYIYDLASGARLERLAEDFVGTLSVSGRRNRTSFFVSLTGFTTPGTVYQYDFSAAEGKRWKLSRSTLVQGLSPDEFVATQVWYKSKDGTRVPMFIVKHTSTKFDGTAPAIQYGYGGFTISINPFFSPSILTFLKAYGAVLAVPNIRGGGEFGEGWHLAGTKERKVNVFDDFTAATEYLVEHKHAGKGLVAINGGSNGGLLVSTCVNRAPEGTFGAAVSEVGVHDLLKFHKYTIGHAWISDYGNPDDPHDFDFIHPISPLQNVPSGKKLPPTLLLTADHDDRVVPHHSFKLAAALQHTAAENPEPLLIRLDKKAGHGAGKATEQKIIEHADKWGFVAQSLGLIWRGA